MRAALSIAAKDLRQKVRDRSAIILSVVAPLSLAFAFSTALPDQTSFDARFVVVDLDGGRVAQALVNGPLANLDQVGITVEQLADEAAARASVDDGSAQAAIVIPSGFSSAVEAARPSEVRIIGSVNATFSTQIAEAVVTGFANGVEAVQVALGTVLPVVGPSPGPADVAEITRAALAAPEPVTLTTDETADRLASSATYYAASMAALFLFFATQFGVVGIHAERRAGTLARMLAAPISARAILAGKVLVSFLLGVVSVGIVAVGTTLLMGARWGDPIAVAALIGAIAVAASGIALLAVGFTRNEDQASGLTAIVAMVLAVLGGSFFPLSQAPEGLAQLSLITPHAWFLRGVDDLASGGGINLVLPSIAVLVAIGVVTGALGLVRARTLVAAR